MEGLCLSCVFSEGLFASVCVRVSQSLASSSSGKWKWLVEAGWLAACSKALSKVPGCCHDPRVQDVDV